LHFKGKENPIWLLLPIHILLALNEFILGAVGAIFTEVVLLAAWVLALAGSAALASLRADALRVDGHEVLGATWTSQIL